MKFIILFAFLCLSTCLANKHKHRARAHAKVHEREPNPTDTSAKTEDGGLGGGAEEEQQAPDDELIKPPTNGNYFDTGSYRSLAWFSTSGVPDENSLIFGTTATFTESYIFFKQTATQNIMGDSGAQLEEKTLLFDGQSHDAYSPYYFMVNGEATIDSTSDSIQFSFVDPKIHPLFEFTKSSNAKLNLAFISMSDVDNMEFILQGMKDKIYTAYLLYNARIVKIHESLTRIKAIRLKIAELKAKLEELMRNGMFEYYNAKAMMMVATLKPSLDEIFGEMEDQEMKVERGAAKLCDNLYVNGEFPFFRELMKDEWTPYKDEYDTSLDLSSGHTKGNASPSESKDGAREGDEKEGEGDKGNGNTGEGEPKDDRNHERRKRRH